MPADAKTNDGAGRGMAPLTLASDGSQPAGASAAWSIPAPTEDHGVADRGGEASTMLRSPIPLTPRELALVERFRTALSRREAAERPGDPR